MRKTIPIILYLSAVIVLSTWLSSCKDEDPKAKPKLSFAQSTMTVSEGAGTIEIEVVLDQPAPEDLIVEYDVDGTAIEGSAAAADYEIDGDVGEVEIRKGETTGIIEITIRQDAVFEGDETIELTIDDVDSDAVEISNDDEIEITITDDDPQALASMVLSTLTVNEADGLIEIEVELDQPATSDITVKYTLSGSAIDSLTAWDNETNADYYIQGTVLNEVVIQSGETTGIISLVVYTDLLIEDANTATAALDPEKIIITLTEANNGVGIGTDDEMEISVVQQDGRVVVLTWDETAGVDMDLFVWIGELGAPVEELSTIPALWSVSPDTDGFEAVFLPDNIVEILLGEPDASFGCSYIYWGGENNDLDFTATFIDITDGVVEGTGTRDSYDATYTLANINPWNDQEDGTFPPAIVQTFDKDGGNYLNISAITVPTAGSRIRTPNKLNLLSGSKPTFKISSGPIRKKTTLNQRLNF